MRSLQAILLLLLLGIATSTSARPRLPRPALTSYYLGEVKMTSPTGQPYGSSISLVKRTLRPDENQIVEIVLSIDAAKPPQEYTTLFTITGNRFVVRDQEGTFEGRGELIGSMWEWTGWKYSVNMLGTMKGKVEADDALSAAGIVVSKSYYSPDGALRVRFAEELKPISSEMYEILHAQLLRK